VNNTFCIAMPCYNESDGILEFLSEVVSSMQTLDCKILVVDDNSRDSTPILVKNFSMTNSNVHLLQNAKNQGHGPSTIIGLKASLGTGCSYIVSIDGDGQFFGDDILRITSQFAKLDVDIIECTRVGRAEPLFRRIVTLTTKMLVFLKTSRFPKDANTPFRIYRSEVLANLLSGVPDSSPVPNLEFSILARRVGYKIKEESVQSRPRRGSSTIGSTWKAKQNIIPSRRFLLFCVKALKRVVTV